MFHNKEYELVDAKNECRQYEQQPAPCLRAVATQLHAAGASLQEMGDFSTALSLYHECISTMNEMVASQCEHVQDAPSSNEECIQHRLAMIELANITLDGFHHEGISETEPIHESLDMLQTFPFTEVIHGDEYGRSTEERDIASTLYNMALIHFKTGNTEKALRLFEMIATLLLDDVPAESTVHTQTAMILSSTLNNIGHILQYCDRYEDASEVFLEALNLVHRSRRDYGGSMWQSRLVHIVANFAVSSICMGETFEKRGRNSDATKVYLRALKKYILVCDVGYGWLLQKFSIIGRNLGFIYSTAGNDGQAMKAFEFSLSLQRYEENNPLSPEVSQLLLDVEILKLTKGDRNAAAA